MGLRWVKSTQTVVNTKDWMEAIYLITEFTVGLKRSLEINTAMKYLLDSIYEICTSKQVVSDTEFVQQIKEIVEKYDLPVEKLLGGDK